MLPDPDAVPEPDLDADPGVFLDPEARPGPSRHRQLAILVAFLVAAIVLLTITGGADAASHALAHLLPSSGGCGGG